MRFNQIRLLVDDFDACFRFYRDVLNLPVGFGNEGDVYADFKLGGDQTLALYRRSDMAAAIGSDAGSSGSGDQTVIVFGVDDLQATVNKLQQHNVELVAGQTERPEWGMRTAHFRDPDGHLIEIFVPLEMRDAVDAVEEVD